MKIPNSRKILLIRMDKIGDLVCTLCVDQSSLTKNDEVIWVISTGLGFIPDHAIPKRKYLELSRDFTLKKFKDFLQFLFQFKPEIVISFQSPAWIHFAIWLARVPIRAGVLSQWHSFLFLNKGLRQKRSQARQHEADYNFDLLKFAINNMNTKEPTPLLKLTPFGDSPVLQENSAHLLGPLGLVEKKYVVVHPGMAGSALNWTLDKYLEFIHKLTQRTLVVLTGTTNDDKWLKPIEESFADNSKVVSLKDKLSPSELLTVLKGAEMVVAPSTGVLHLAAALGVPTMGIYSPVQVHHPRRWGARGPLAKNITPEDIQCPEVFQCALTACKHYNCMQKVYL